MIFRLGWNVAVLGVVVVDGNAAELSQNSTITIIKLDVNLNRDFTETKLYQCAALPFLPYRCVVVNQIIWKCGFDKFRI